MRFLRPGVDGVKSRCGKAVVLLFLIVVIGNYLYSILSAVSTSENVAETVNIIQGVPLEEQNNEEEKIEANAASLKAAVEKSRDVIAVEVKDTETTEANTTPKKTDYLEEMYEPGYIIPNPEACPSNGRSLKVLILITSAANHFIHRKGIRYTWGHYSSRSDVSMAFFIGSTDNDTIQTGIDDESALYGDIIQSKNFDTYRNLTLKTISLLQWADSFCPYANFILKADDDMFINVEKLLTFIDKHKDAKRTIFGQKAHRWKPIRNPKSKYYISRDEFLPTYLPDFTTGPAYLLTGDLVRELYTEALKRKYFLLEDVFFTGIIANDLNIERVKSNEFHPYVKRKKTDPCNVHNTISTHDVKFRELLDMWMKLQDGKHPCTKKS